MSQGFNYEKTYHGETDTWLTPPFIYQSLGRFDLDPCAHADNDTAEKKIILPECGLSAEWVGRVWCNPPYGPLTKKWLEKMSVHNHGTALVMSRTDTRWFHSAVKSASALLFLEGRIQFLKPGLIAPERSGSTCGSVLIAYGSFDAEKLIKSSLKGFRCRP